MMVLRHRRLLASLCVAAVLLALATPAAACSVCQGNPDSELVKGAQGGVIVMVLVTYGVLMIFGTMIAVWFVRARRLERQHNAAAHRPPTASHMNRSSRSTDA